MHKKFLLLLVAVMTIVLTPLVSARRSGRAAEPQVVQAQSSVGLVGFAGYVVEDVAADSPAAEAGLRQNDIVTYIDNRPVRSLDTIKDTFGLTPPGKTLEFKVLRYDPAAKRYSLYVFNLKTIPPLAPGTTKWLYRQAQNP